MTDRSPSKILTAAAKLLREQAGNAQHISPAPWTVDQGGAYGAGVVLARDGATIIADRSCDEHEDAIDLPYIALMHPGVGLALADWLNDAAEGDAQGEINPYALAVARQLLGGES
jgi:hypothetical protein